MLRCSFISRIPVVLNLFTSHIFYFKGTETPGKSPLNLLDFFPSFEEVSAVLRIREQSNNLSNNKPPPPPVMHCTYIHQPLLGFWAFEDGSDRLSRNVGKELSLLAA